MSGPTGFVLALAAALLGGGVNAIAGGGSLLVYPVLLAAGLPPVSANVTTTAAMWPGYVTGAAAYRDEVRADARRALVLSAVAVVGAVGGTALLLAAPSRVFGAVVPFLVIFAAVLLAVQPSVTRWLARRRPDAPHPRWLLPVGMLLASAYGAYFGGGLGIILLAVLALGLARPLGELNGLKTLIALVANTVALVTFALLGPVHWAYALGMAPASFLGGIAGSRLARRIDSRTLRAVVVAAGIAIGVRLLLA